MLFKINMSSDDKAIILEQSLRDLYYDPVSGYQSIEKLYKEAKKEGLDVSRQKGKNVATSSRNVHKV